VNRDGGVVDATQLAEGARCDQGLYQGRARQGQQHLQGKFLHLTEEVYSRALEASSKIKEKARIQPSLFTIFKAEAKESII
jgi:hypothetical protein